MYKNAYVPDPTRLFDELMALEWETQRSARQEYFMSLSPREYTYGNRGTGDATYRSKPFSTLALELCERLNREFDVQFNVCFLNKYDNEKNHLGWHADNFPGMRADQPISVVSLGAEREIWVKPKDHRGEIPDEWRYLLKNGSLFTMPPGYQDTHLHKIPKWDRPCGCRISMTFRSFV